jgi:serine/threonine protein kinase
MAPEVVLGKSHSYPVDYWSFGCIIFELLTGLPPFHESTESETFHSILFRNADFSLLSGCSPTVIDLLSRLLIRDPNTRLGAGGVGEIMAHPWFEGTEWDHVFDIPPVFVPEPLAPEVANEYFVERYAFSGSEDDITDDVEYDQMFTDIRRRNGEPPVSGSGFHRVGLDHLDSSNRELATKLRLQPGLTRPVPPVTPLTKVMTFPTESSAFHEPSDHKRQ